MNVRKLFLASPESRCSQFPRLIDGIATSCIHLPKGRYWGALGLQDKGLFLTYHFDPSIWRTSWKPRGIQEGDHLGLQPFEQDDGFLSTGHHHLWH
jgi:hypothetical protein